MTPTDILHDLADNNQTTSGELGKMILDQLCQRLPASTLADMVAHIIGSDEEGESEATSDFLYAVGKHRFGTTDWLLAIEKARNFAA